MYGTETGFRAKYDAADLTALFGDLTAGEQTTWIEQALAEQSDELDGYCLGRYAVPLHESDSVLNYVYQLAWWALCRRRNWNYTDQEQKNEKELRRRLELIAAHKFHLKDQSSAQSADNRTSLRATDPSARVTGRRRIMGRDRLEF
ncbi:phage protein Gp36 family protein [Zavarzinia sp.]|uniref:phage protein Gp36 family protein n=1 Tax=Zavarzinia sp. TaxID=2027920 RepID=UPI00356AE4D4